MAWLSSSRKKSSIGAQSRDAYHTLGTSATVGGGGGVGVEGETWIEVPKLRRLGKAVPPEFPRQPGIAPKAHDLHGSALRSHGWYRPLAPHP